MRDIRSQLKQMNEEYIDREFNKKVFERAVQIGMNVCARWAIDRDTNAFCEYAEAKARKERYGRI